MNEPTAQSRSYILKRLFHTNNVGFGLGIFLVCIYLSTINLFLAVNSVENLPKLLFRIGLIGILTSFVFDFIQKRRPTKEIGSLFLLAFVFGYNYIDNLISSGSEENIQLASYISTLALVPVTIVVKAIFQAIIDDLMNIQEKKVYALKLNWGITLGCLIIATIIILANYTQQGNVEDETIKAILNFWKPILAPLSNNINALIPVAMIGCIWSILMLNLAAIRNQSLGELQWSVQYINYNTRIKRIIKNKYFVAFFFYITSATVATISFYAIFLYVFESSSKSEYDINQILAYYFIVQIFFILIFTGVSKSLIVRQLGLKKILQFIPITVLTFTIVGLTVMYFFNVDKEVFSIVFFVLMISGTVLLSSLMIGLQKPVLELYSAPIEEALRTNTINLMEGFVRYFGIILVGGMMLGLLTLDNTCAAQDLFVKYESRLFPWACGAIAIVSSIMWLIALSHFYRIYTSKLQDSLNKQTQLIKQNESFSESTVVRLEREIMDSDLPKITYQLRMLQSMDPLVYRRVLIKLVNHDNENIQSIIITEVVKYQLTQALPILKEYPSLKNFSTLKTSKQILKAIENLKEAKDRVDEDEYINQLTSSKISSERLLGALLAQHIPDHDKGRVLNKLFTDYKDNTIYNAIVAASGSDNDELHLNLVKRLQSPQFTNAALSSIGASGDELLDKLEAAFHLGKRNQKLQQRILQAYGKIGSKKAANMLLSKLNYPNQNVVTSCLDALSRCGLTLTDDDMALQVRSEVEEVCGVAIWNMSAYEDTLAHGFEGALLEALEHEITFNYNTIFRLLALLYDPKTVESVKNNIDSDDIEEAEFASQLLDIFIYDQMKLFLIPMFKRSSYSEKIIELMGTFPTEPMKKSELLVSIIQKDYKWINSWTKTCALKEISRLTSFDSREVMIAQLINPNAVLREAAAETLLEQYKPEFETCKLQYQNHPQFNFAYETMNRLEQEENSGQSSDLLKFEIISFLSRVKEMKDVPSLMLSELTRHISIQDFKKGETIIESKVSKLDYYFIYKGIVTLTYPQELIDYTEEEMINKLGISSSEETIIKLRATQNVTIMKIDNFVFEELFTFHEEIPNSILNHLNKSSQDSVQTQLYETA